MRRRRIGLATLLAAAGARGEGHEGHAGGAGPASPTHARTWRVPIGGRLHDVVAAARDGDTVELESGHHHNQTAVVTQRRLTLRGAGGATAVLHADGAHAEGKALLVVRGGHVLVEDLTFRGARVPDGNGAGIRFESGVLTLRRCAFFDNEMGLLSANRADAELDIEDCDFGQAPRHDGALHHLLYVGSLRRFRLTGSRLSGGWRGHLVKSRAQHNLILCNQLVDGDGGEASYELDLPNGGLAWVLGNVIAQGPKPQNQTLVAFGAEGPAHADSALFVAHNSVVNEALAPATFVRHWPQRLPPDTELRLQHNLLIGHGLDSSRGEAADGNVWHALDALDRAPWPRVSLRGGLPAAATGPPAAPARGVALAPRHQITFPLGMRPLAPRPQWRAGAFQD